MEIFPRLPFVKLHSMKGTVRTELRTKRDMNIEMDRSVRCGRRLQRAADLKGKTSGGLVLYYPCDEIFHDHDFYLSILMR
jgi:hypothetical protein